MKGLAYIGVSILLVALICHSAKAELNSDEIVETIISCVTRNTPPPELLGYLNALKETPSIVRVSTNDLPEDFRDSPRIQSFHQLIRAYAGFEVDLRLNSVQDFASIPYPSLDSRFCPEIPASVVIQGTKSISFAVFEEVSKGLLFYDDFFKSEDAMEKLGYCVQQMNGLMSNGSGLTEEQRRTFESYIVSITPLLAVAAERSGKRILLREGTYEKFSYLRNQLGVSVNVLGIEIPGFGVLSTITRDSLNQLEKSK